VTDRDETRDDISYSIRHPKWYDKFVSPAGVMILFGAIVWGIQLNFATLHNTQAIGELRATQAEGVRLLNETALKMERISAMLGALERRHSEHLTEAELWKERILQNSGARERAYNAPGKP